MGHAGLIAGSSGNVSLRLPADRMLISATGTNADAINTGAIIETGFDTPSPRVSSEWALHAAIYAARPELHAIIHTHAEAGTALACLGEDLPAFHYEVAAFGGTEIRCTPYTTFGTPELAALAVTALDGRTACLLGNHGVITTGPTLDRALAAAFQLERLCRQYLLARAAGTPRLLTPAQVKQAQARFKTYQRE